MKQMKIFRERIDCNLDVVTRINTFIEEGRMKTGWEKVKSIVEVQVIGCDYILYYDDGMKE